MFFIYWIQIELKQQAIQIPEMIAIADQRPTHTNKMNTNSIRYYYSRCGFVHLVFLYSNFCIAVNNALLKLT